MSFWQRTKDALRDSQNLRMLSRFGVTAGMTAAGITDPLLQEGVRDFVDQMALTMTHRRAATAYHDPVAVTLVPLRLSGAARGTLVAFTPLKKNPQGLWVRDDAAPEYVDPYVFSRESYAVLYAQYVREGVMLDRTVPRSARARQLTDAWLERRVAPLALTEPLGDYVAGPAPAPGEGYVAWRTVLTARGPRIGVFSDQNPLSFEDPPFVFSTLAAVDKALYSTQPKYPRDKTIVFTPDTLAERLAPRDPQTTLGGSVYERQPEPWPLLALGQPEALKRTDASGVGFNAHPDFFVSQGLDRQWQAWQPVGEGSGSVLLQRHHDNSWHPIRWSDREQAFAVLNRLGLWSQGSPEGLAPESLGVTLRIKV